MITKHQIVYQLYPTTARTEAETTETSSIKAFDKDDKEISLNAAAIDAEFAKQDYKNKRIYPDLGEQLDLLYWDKKNGTNKWVEAIDKVKSDNPKS